MRTDRIQVRVFIEGILVPTVNAVAVNCADNESATATLSMAPVPGFETEELTRARVHVFWSDIDIRSSRADDEWPLLFEGEVVGDGWGKQVSSRDMSLMCAGYHTYWEQVLLYFFDPGTAKFPQTPWTNNIAMFLGNNQIKFDAPIAGAQLGHRMASKFEEHKTEPYYNVVRHIFGEALDTNFFFAQADAALKLINRMVAAKDEGVGRLISSEMLKQALQQEISSISGDRSMMDVLKRVLSLFRYSIVCNPQPMYIGAAGQQEESRRATAALRKAQEASAREDLERALIASGISESTAQGVAESIGADNSDQAIKLSAQDLEAEVLLSDTETARTGVGEAAESLPNDAASLANVLKATRDELKRIEALGQTKPSELQEPIDAIEDVLAQYLLVPDTRFALPPACNVIFPQDQTGLGMQRNLLQQPTRAIAMPTQLANLAMPVYMVPSELKDAKIPTVDVAAVSKDGYSLPVDKPWKISSGYGFRQIKALVDTGKVDANGNPIRKVLHPDGARFHHGVDIVDPHGAGVIEGRPVKAFDDGKVVFADQQDPTNIKVGYGKYVKIAHSNGLTTFYGHLSAHAPGIRTGKDVKAGDVIGYVGTTGQSTGPHLHFEVRRGGLSLDPTSILKTLDARAAGDFDDVANPQSVAVGSNNPVSSVATEATTMESAVKSPNGDPFLDYKYLTPEEQITGIVPYFDDIVSQAHSIVDFGGSGDSAAYITALLESEWLWRRYSTRSMQSLNMPFNPRVVAGFPGLVVDRMRSIIGRVKSVSHVVSVGGGNGNASSIVEMEAPRFWDEGDPYFWKDGAEKFSKDKDGKSIPDATVANFPSYLHPGLIGTNSGSYEATSETNEKFDRSVDRFYKALLGCNAIPYQYASRQTITTATVAYNRAIDDRREVESEPGSQNTKTIVGRYYELVDRNPQEAEGFVRRFTERLVVNERQLMTEVLGATADVTGTVYTGGPFRGPVEDRSRKSYQDLVRRMNTILASQPAHRG